MDRNFSITSTVEISSAGRSYDLHNDFDFSEVKFDAANSVITLLWVNSREVVRLSFKSVKFLRVKGFDEAMPREEDCRLSFMGYLHPDDLDLMDGFLPEDMADEKYHAIFCFEGGLSMRVFADSGELSVQEASSVGHIHRAAKIEGNGGN